MSRASVGAAALGVALCVLVLPSVAFAASEILSSRRVRVVAEADSDGPREGYLTLVVRCENRTPASQRVSLRFESRPAASIESEVSLGPGEQRRIPLLLPATARYGTLSASDGHESGREGFSWQWQAQDAVLVDNCEQVQPLLERRKGAATGTVRPVLTVGAADYPETLAAYSGYAAVGVVAARFEDLPEPQRRALEAYAATGGRLFLGTVPARPEQLFPLWRAGASSAGPGVHPYGFGTLHFFKSQERCVEALGGVGAIARPALAAERVTGSRHRYRSLPWGTDLPEGEPLLDVARVPVGGFLLLVLLFVLVIGPGSFVVRARRGPHALLLFVPLTALVTCGGIASYGVASEGLFTIHASSRTATLLDAEQHRAVTVSVDSFYAGLGPSQVRFGALTAVLPPAERYGADMLLLDETEGMVFRGGLIPSRGYREYLTLSAVPSRARLSLRGEPGGREDVTVENALGARITSGVLRVGQAVCTLREVADQARAVVQCDLGSDELDPTRVLALADRFDPARVVSVPLSRFQGGSLASNLLAPLEAGEFVVVLDRAAFAPDGGLTLARRDDRQLVRGKVSP